MDRFCRALSVELCLEPKVPFLKRNDVRTICLFISKKIFYFLKNSHFQLKYSCSGESTRIWNIMNREPVKCIGEIIRARNSIIFMQLLSYRSRMSSVQSENVYQLINEFPHFYIYHQPCCSDLIYRLFTASWKWKVSGRDMFLYCFLAFLIFGFVKSTFGVTFIKCRNKILQNPRLSEFLNPALCQSNVLFSFCMVSRRYCTQHLLQLIKQITFEQ